MTINKTKKWLSLSFLLITILIIYGIKSSTTVLSSELENSIPRQYAVKKAKNNLKVLKAIGDSIKVNSEIRKMNNKGRFSLSIGSSGVDFSQKTIDAKIYLTGNIDAATLIVIAKNVESKWMYSQLFVIVNSTGEKINLL